MIAKVRLIEVNRGIYTSIKRKVQLRIIIGRNTRNCRVKSFDAKYFKNFSRGILSTLKSPVITQCGNKYILDKILSRFDIKYCNGTRGDLYTDTSVTVSCVTHGSKY